MENKVLARERISSIAPGKVEIMQYDISFPPGSMGLELEPVIISSERQIGCRVRDFYFEIDHEGISVDELKSRVSIGDIVWFVAGENVLSSKFDDILSTLRSLRSEWRTITFKSISASDVHGNTSRNVQDSVRKQVTSKPQDSIIDKENITSTIVDPPKRVPDENSPRASTRKVESMTELAHFKKESMHGSQGYRFTIPIPPPLQTRPQPRQLTENTARGPNQTESSTATKPTGPKSGGFGRFMDKALSPSKVVADDSENSNISTTDINSTINFTSNMHKKRKQDANPSPLFNSPVPSRTPVKQHGEVAAASPRPLHQHRNTMNLPENMEPSMTLSPAKVRQLTRELTEAGMSAMQQELHVNKDGADVGVLQHLAIADSTEQTESQSEAVKATRRRRNRSLLPTIPPELVRILGDIGHSIGSGLLEVGKDVGIGATNAALTVGSAVGTVVGDQAERLVDQATQAVPRYSEVEVRTMMEKKNTLLNELARTSMLLGAAQDRQINLEQETLHLRAQELKLMEKLQSDERQISEILNEIENLRAEKFHMKTMYERTLSENQEEIEEWKRISSEHKDRCSRLLHQLESAENAVVATRDELNREREIIARSQEAWDAQWQRVVAEQASVRDEMHGTVTSLDAQLRRTQGERDKIENDLRTLREAHRTEQRHWHDEKMELQHRLLSLQENFQDRLLQLEAQLDVSKKSSAEFRIQWEDVGAELYATRQQCSVLDMQNSQLEAEIRSHVATIKIMDSKIAHLEESSNGALAEVDAFRSASSSHLARANELEEMIEFYRLQNAAASEREASLIRRNSELTMEIEKLAQEKCDLQQSVMQQQDRNVELTVEFKNLESQLTSSLDEAMEKLRMADTTINQLQIDLEAKGVALVSALDAASLAQQECVQHFMTISAQEAKASQEKEKHQFELDQCQEELGERIEDFKSQILALSEKLRLAGERATENEATWTARLQEETHKSYEVIRELQNNGAILQSDIQTAQLQLMEKTEWSASLAKQLELSEVNNRELVRKIIDIGQASMSNIAHLRSDLKALKLEHSESIELQSTIARSHMQAADVTQRLEVSSQRENERLKLLVDGLQKNLKDMFERATAAESNTIAVEERHLAALADVSTIRSQFLELQENHVQLKVTTDNSMKTLRQRVCELELGILDSNDNSQRAAKELSGAQSELDHLRSELQSKDYQIAAISTDFQARETEFVSLAAQLASSESRNSQMEQQVEKLSEQLKSTLCELDDMRESFNSLQFSAGIEDTRQRALEESCRSWAEKFEVATEDHRVDRLRIIATAEGRIMEARRQLEEQTEKLRKEMDAMETGHKAAVASIIQKHEVAVSQLNESLSNEARKNDDLISGLKEDLGIQRREADRIRGLESEFLSKLQEQDACNCEALLKIAKLSAELQELHVARSTAESAASIALQELAELRAKFESTDSAAPSSVGQDIACSPLRPTSAIRYSRDLRIEYAAEENSRNGTQADLALSKANCAAVSLECTQAKHDRDEAKAVVERLSTEIAILKESLTGSKNDQAVLAEKLEKSLEIGRKENSELTARLVTAEHSLTASIESNYSLKQVIDQLHSEFRDKVCEIAQLKDAKELMAKDLAGTQDSLRCCECDLQKYLALVQFHEHRANSLVQERELLLQKIEECEETYSLKICDLEAKFEALEAQRTAEREKMIDAHAQSTKTALESLSNEQAETCRLKRELELARAELHGTSALVEKMVEVTTERNALISAVQGLENNSHQLDQENQKLAKQIEEMMSSHVEAEQSYKQKILELIGSHNDAVKDLERRLSDEQLDYNIILREKEQCEKALLACQMELVTSNDLLLANRAELSESKSKTALLQNDCDELNSLIEIHTVKIDALNEQCQLAGAKLKLESEKVEMLTLELSTCRVELEKVLTREAEIVSVMMMQTAALQQAQDRECEFHESRVQLELLVVDANKRNQEISQRALETESSAIKRVSDAETTIRELRTALEEALDVRGRLQASLAKKRAEFDELAGTLGRLVNSDGSPLKSSQISADTLPDNSSKQATEVLKSSPESVSSPESARSDTSVLIDDLVTWHDQIFSELLRLHQCLLECFQSKEQATSHMINLSVCLDQLQQLFLTAPFLSSSDAAPAFPVAPHLIKGSMTGLDSVLSAKDCVASPKSAHEILDKENATPPMKSSTRRKSSISELDDSAILVSRSLFEENENGATSVDVCHDMQRKVAKKILIQHANNLSDSPFLDPAKALEQIESLTYKWKQSEVDNHVLREALNRAEDTIAALADQVSRAYGGEATATTDTSVIGGNGDLNDSDFWNLSSEGEE